MTKTHLGGHRIPETCAKANEKIEIWAGRQPESGFRTTTDNYFSGIAGNRFKVRLAGSITTPTDSRAVTPRMGSALSGPKMTRPAVTSFMNEISTRPN